MAGKKEPAHAVLSASSSARWLACPPSAIAATLYPNTATAYTAEGTRAHSAAEKAARAALFGEPEPGDEYDKPMREHAKSYADYILEQIRDPSTAVVLLEQRVDFSPWVPGGFGTADCIIIQGNEMHIIDYKYGEGVKVSAVDNPQMKLYACGALNDFGIAYEPEKVVMHIFQPRIDHTSAHEVNTQALMAWAAGTVAVTAGQIMAGRGEYTPGEHCRFCPHAGKCKALAKVCTEATKVNGKTYKVEHLAPWEVAGILQREPLISLWLKRVKDQALTDLLNGEQIPGYKVVAGRSSREWADDLHTANYLQSVGFTLNEITKTELLSVAQMEKALGKKKVAEILTDHIRTKTGAPTVVPESDKRPAYNRVEEAQKDYE